MDELMNGRRRETSGNANDDTATATANLERHRQQVAQLLEIGKPDQAIHVLLTATRKAVLERAALLMFASLSRELFLRAEAGEALAEAIRAVATPTDRTLLCLLAARLLCADRQFSRARDVLQKALEQQPSGDLALERRLIFVALRAGEIESAIELVNRQIAQARHTGNRRRAARLDQWLGMLFEARLADHFRAAECHARAAALCKALNSPRETFRAQCHAVLCLSRIDPPPRQFVGAIKALRTTAKAAGCSADAEVLLRSLGLEIEHTPAAAPTDPPSPSPLASTSNQTPIPSSMVTPTPELLSTPDATPAEARTPAASGRFLSFFQEAEQQRINPGPVKRDARGERHQLERRAAEAPFDAARYRALAAHYLAHQREPLAQLVSDVADALEGRTSERPSAPSLTLNDEDWNLIQHPIMGSAAHEIGALIGSAVCEICAKPLASFEPRGTFAMDGSDSAWTMADALLCAVRVLGVRAGDVHLAKEKDAHLPIFPVCSTPPALFVSPPKLRQKLSSAQLRFFAGRALATLRPELGMFLLLPLDQVDAVLDGLRRALLREGRMTEKTRAIVQRISGKSAERLMWLFERPFDETFCAAYFREGAGHTVNRLGLLTAGNIAPALSALEFAGASEAERAELLRFAISKAYFELRLRRG